MRFVRQSQTIKVTNLDGKVQTNKWIEMLLRLVSDYNARKHRTIGMRPADVTPAIAKRHLGTVYSATKIAGPAKFKVGDAVRIAKTNLIIMPQPPYSQTRFATIEEIKTALLEELIPKSAYQQCFEDWKKRWHKCIISEGDYFEGDKIDTFLN
ncbi:hypothetical protein ALC62_14059 [Cyphomyrmex costatus]|uniref:Integrase catalytic domain-containing protein n=1 Tax=Cyphomyrmex costatus TaxID=456900 RepID=A0A151K2I8_9HYME|nr:hypothetical protein ALC62_14059 [Cyphomyrmex costatus]